METKLGGKETRSKTELERSPLQCTLVIFHSSVLNMSKTGVKPDSFNLSSVSSKSAWTTQQVPGLPRWYSETLCPKEWTSVLGM